jgi:hypothetical protein
VGQGITDVGFLNGISLPDGEETFGTRVLQPAVRERLREKLASQRADVPGDVRKFFSGFYGDWQSSTDFTQVASQYFDAKQFAETVHVEVSDPTEFVAQTLRLWRLADHGVVSMLGHRVPAPGTQQRAYFEKLIGDKRSLARYEPWIDAFIPLTRDAEEPYLILPVKDSPSRFISLARFLNSPYDTTLVVAERTVAGFKITGIESAVDH